MNRLKSFWKKLSGNSAEIKSKGTTTMRINGEVFVGSHIVLSGDTVWVDGEQRTIKGSQIIKIQVMGDAELVKVQAGEVAVEGNVETIFLEAGDITCKDVTGSISVDTGDINCGNVGGAVSVDCGDLVMGKKIS